MTDLASLIAQEPTPETDALYDVSEGLAFARRHGDMFALSRSLERRLSVAIRLLEDKRGYKCGSDERDQWISDVYALLPALRGEA